MKAPYVLAFLLLPVPLVALAGVNAGGTMILHANTTIQYTTNTTNYCGQSGLTACSSATASVPASPSVTTVFYALAAFPDPSSPRLKGLTFGIQYDHSKFELVAHGPCAGTEQPGAGWPGSGTGTSLAWNTTQTAGLVEAYWFAGHVYASPDSCAFILTPHPDPGLGGKFADDSVPSQLDSIADYGRLGFGVAGYRACPSTGGGGQNGPIFNGGGGSSPCQYPVTCTIAHNNYLIVVNAADSLVYSDTQVVFTQSGPDTLLLNGHVLYPPREAPLPDSVYERLDGHVPLISHLRQLGYSWKAASDSFDAATRVLQGRARARYEDTLNRGHDQAAAVAAALALLSHDPLVDSTTTVAPYPTYPKFIVQYRGWTCTVGMRLVLPHSWSNPPPSKASNNCALVTHCQQYLSRTTTPVVILLRYGGVAIMTGNEAYQYLLTGRR